MKKGISAVFQYIMVAIVGAMILFFFIWFTYRSTESFESLNSAYVASTLKDSFTALSVSGHSSTKFPERGWLEDIEFKLGRDVDCGKISVDDTNFISVDKIIYGPSSLKGKQFNVWTRAWKYPYKITNFFYVNNKRTKYFLVYDDGDVDTKNFVKEIDSITGGDPTAPLDHIPKSFNVKAISKSSVSGYTNLANTNDFVKFVFFDTEPNIAGSENVKVIQIKNYVCNGEYDCKGEVYFGNGILVNYFYGKAMMFGAIFADSFEQYECNYDRAAESFDKINDIYYEKADALEIAYLGCNYNALRNNIENVNMETFAENMMNANEGSSSTGGNCENVF